MKKNNHIIRRVKNITVIGNVKKNISNNYLSMSKIPIVAYERLAKINKNIIGDMLLLIKKESLTSKQDDMQDKEMQKAHTLLRNGKNFVENIIGDARNVQKKETYQRPYSASFGKRDGLYFKHSTALSVL